MDIVDMGAHPLSSPLIYNGVDPDPSTQPVQWTGHSDIVQTANGDWWGVCLGIRPQGGNISRSQLGTMDFTTPQEVVLKNYLQAERLFFSLSTGHLTAGRYSTIISP